MIRAIRFFAGAQDDKGVVWLSYGWLSKSMLIQDWYEKLYQKGVFHKLSFSLTPFFALLFLTS